MIVTGTRQQRAWQERVLPPVEQVRPGVWSIPVPIPHNPLRYTLSYAFLDDAGAVLVDPGWESPSGRAALTEGATAAGFRIADVTGVVLTHTHPDHHGLSGWVRETAGAWIGMHPAEAEALPGRVWRGRSAGAGRDWLVLHGVPEAEVGDLLLDSRYARHLMSMAEPDRAFEDGDLLPLGRHRVRAVWTPGHTPGHLCLHDADAAILLTGDHLLPRISPNIAVHIGDDGDPLTDYLSSLGETGKYAAEEALPAHEYRFRGIDARAADLIRHHDERGQEIVRAMRTGKSTTWEIAAALTWSRGWAALHGMPRRMALAETVAHLHHLRTIGSVSATGGTPERWRIRSEHA
jgi:glyoxylase-like metal-dependent hydrolase (beta-lactamase superfamily II)